ncbi:ECF RNA polymerase sigma factor SigJ [Pirellulimonas nuda]|uniref:ECF RNA polymerase sigma factor SigJ n=1 Tax=Pirellulimonas nuda TaxID=2528009 RepID=A0A518D6X7_9BACT|nr:RNA polymerase sigma factor SigJ [Pirellulimonas nuda]QDU87242.1 ECF RNA polymerase sigma factor SigJ [Pirellulimonas nuda]
MVGSIADGGSATQSSATLDGAHELRPRMMSVAYRMLGSVVDAEDAVQDAFLRLQNARDVRSPEGFLIRTTTRRCIDHLRAARRRESYIGPWVPEPVDTSTGMHDASMEESLSQGFLLMLERLSPRERAAFVLRTVFDYEFSEVAECLGVSEAYVRKIVSRAKAHLAEAVPRFRPPPEKAVELAEQFVAACRAGDVKTVEQLLTDDVEAHSDGGGKVFAARVVVRGRARVAKYLSVVFHKKRRGCEMHAATVNGDPGVFFTQDGVVKHVVSLRIEHGVSGVYMSVNPEKLARWSVAKVD